MWIIRRSTVGFSITRLKWKNACGGTGNLPWAPVGEWMKPTIKVKGEWTYLYRAIDKKGHTIDFYLSPTRNTQAAKRFLGKALKSMKPWAHPGAINTDKAPAYRAAITELKAEGKCPP